jgi:prepilin peptidase CpaA
MTPVLIHIIILSALAVTAAAYDIRSRRIPNWLCLTGFLVGLGINFLLEGVMGLRGSLLGCGFAALVYVPLFAIRAMGAGDAKLMMAIGAIVGPANWFVIFLLTSVLGAVLGVVRLLIGGGLRTALWNVAFIVSQLMRFRAPYIAREELDVRHRKAVTMPHGAAIAMGSIVFVVKALM